MTKGLKIGLIGGGIGGITAAIAMQKYGLNPIVYEQAPKLEEVGAGITIGPNANHVLNGLGLESKLESLAEASPNVGTLHYQTGERLSYVSRGRQEYLKRFGAVSRLMHRADIYNLLLDAFASNSQNLKLNHKLIEIEQDTEAVALTFSNGATEYCDVVIACDGIKSSVRDKIFVTEPPEFTGFVAWRGLVDRHLAPKVILDPHFAAFPAENKLFGRYPVRHNTLINYVAVARKPNLSSESWSQRADVSEVLNEFEGWHDDVVNIIRATPDDRCLRWALHSRKPMHTWINGRISLLGDAAHPMTPFYGMGAGMAIEDALILARCFSEVGSDWESALARYEKARLGRANKMHLDSLERGEAFMSSDPKKRGQPPSSGLDDQLRYNANTVSI